MKGTSLTHYILTSVNFQAIDSVLVQYYSFPLFYSTLNFSKICLSLVNFPPKIYNSPHSIEMNNQYQIYK